MKKTLLAVAAFTFILTGCQKSRVVDNLNDDNNQLTFGVYAGKATKASELGQSDIVSNGVNFPIYAYIGSGANQAFYFAETLTYDSPIAGKWNTTIPRFLHATEPVNYYAYYASSDMDNIVYAPATGDLSAATVPTLTYTIQADPADQVDVVAATVKHNGTKVTLPFKHVLSQINFGVKGYYGAKIEIANISVNDVNEAGTFSYGTWAWEPTAATQSYIYPYAGTSKAFTTNGGVYASNKWSDPNNESDITYIFGDGGNYGPGKAASTWYVGADGKAVQGTGTLPALSNSLMLLPQTLGTTATVTFDYKIQDLDGAYVIGSINEYAKGTFKLGDLSQNVWQPNLRYVYIIDFTGYLDGQLLTFEIDLQSNPWENYDWNGTPGGGTGVVDVNYLGAYLKKLTAGTTTTIVGTLNAYTNNVVWDWSAPALFPALNDQDSFTLDLSKVVFDGYEIVMKLPVGYTVSGGTASYTVEGQTWTITTAGTLVITYTAQP